MLGPSRHRHRHRRGTDVAVEIAHVVLMRSDPLDIAAAIDSPGPPLTNMKQNVGWASIYNLLAIPSPLAHYSPAPASSSAHNGPPCSCQPVPSSWPPTRYCSNALRAACQAWLDNRTNAP
jgi:hypothetical protein